MSYLLALCAVAAAWWKHSTGRVLPVSASRWFLVIGLGTLGLALALAAPETVRAAEPYGVLPDGIRLLGHVLALLSCYCTMGLTALVPDDHRHRSCDLWSRAAVLLASSVGLVVLHVVAPQRGTAADAGAYAHDPATVAYMVIFLGYVTWAMVELHLVLRRNIHAAATAIARTGLGLTRAAVFAGYLTIVTTAAGIVGGVPGFGALSGVAALTGPALAICVVLFAGGATYRDWAPTVLNLPPSRWVRAVVAYWRLRPLSRAVRRDLPQLAVLSPRHVLGGWVLRRVTIGWLLHRRVIEIRDAELFLAPYVPADIDALVADAARTSSPGVNERGLLLAARIAVALDGYRAGHRARPPAGPMSGSDAIGSGDGGTLEEAAELLQVARYFGESTVLAAVRRELAVA